MDVILNISRVARVREKWVRAVYLTFVFALCIT